MTPSRDPAKYPGVRAAVDGSAAVVAMETAASEAAGAYPITPSTQMGEGWAAAVAADKRNVNGRRLLFFEPEGEHAAAAVTAGMSMVGLRSANFSSGQGIAYMHESLYPAVGKRLTYVLNVACRAMTKQALNVHAGHDDYHAVDDTGFFQVFAKDVQAVADLNLISHRIAELSLNPGICAQDGFLTSHVIEVVNLPEPELVKEYLGDPADLIECPTPAQRFVFGERRRRIPEMFDLDYPAMLGVVQNQDAYAQGVAAQRPFYFDHVVELTDRAFAEFAALTGREYRRASGYRLDDAEYVIVGQGSVVSNAEALCDHLRASRGLRVGVLDVTMFRPFPADVISHLLQGKKAVAVLERVDQPLAVDAPLLKEIRAAVGKAFENGRHTAAPPYPGVASYMPGEVPEFYSGCFGLGSRDLQPAELLAAVENMLDGGKKRRQYYLGVDFVREGTRLPKLEIWQQELLDAYPRLGELSLHPDENPNLLPDGAVSIRIHSVGGWGAITMGKNLAVTSSELLGLYIKANPKYGSEKKGQPTTFYATLAPEPVRLNCELRDVDVVLSPDPNVFHHSNPLAGLADDGIFVIQSHLTPAELWQSFPARAQRRLKEGRIRVYSVDAFRIAGDEASDVELRYRMQGAAFMGAFFKVTPLVSDAGLGEDELLGGIRKQIEKKFGHLGERVVDDNYRVIQRGYAEVLALDVSACETTPEEAAAPPTMPAEMRTETAPGIGDPARFWENVGHLYRAGEDGIADPFAAISAIPAVTSTIRDMTNVRFEVPHFVADKCTGCSRCWTQCPDVAIPGVVNTVEEVIETAVESASEREPILRLRQLVKHLARESRKLMRGAPFHSFAETLSVAYQNVSDKLAPEPARREALDKEFGRVYGVLEDFPLARTAPFFEVPEAKEKNTGGLLSITVNPEACKGCNLCVEVCPDGALVTVAQDDEIVDTLRRNWDFWRKLPDTDDRYVNVASLEEGIGVLPSLLLKKENYRSMAGGDGACMGCGEKTAIHLVLSAVNALMGPRIEKLVTRLDELMGRLEARARELVASDADLATLAVELEPEKRGEVDRILAALEEVRDLRWRYTEGPSGKGRSNVAFTNSTGCSSVWGSTYPYNPYPFPWANHLFQDAPSLAIGVFEGHMRKMADGFIVLRRAEALAEGRYDSETDEDLFSHFDWHQFTDEEFDLCPPIFAVGGDGAMLDIGFQNLSRLLASGKPIRVVVLDTQVYSNTGGQACTSGFFGQVSDMAGFGGGQHGKTETRKELALIGIAHRGAYVLQSSQAAASHFLGGVLKGLQTRRPAVFALHCPCPPEHGIGDDAAVHAARLSLESRAFPLIEYDPDAGDTLAERLSLDGNPAIHEAWPTYDLEYLDDDGNEAKLTLPMTIADWAATEARFAKHYSRLPDELAADALPFAEYFALDADARGDQVPFIYILDSDRHLQRLRVAPEVVQLAEERQSYWTLLKQMAGVEVEEGTRDTVVHELESELDDKIAALRSEYEQKITDLKEHYPPAIALRLAEGLLRAGNGKSTLGELLETLPNAGPGKLRFAVPETGTHVEADAPPGGETAPSAATAPATAAVAEKSEAEESQVDSDDDDLGLEPYIDTARCTACNECTDLNNRMFAYNEDKQAFIKDPKAGTYKDLVTAAERCPVEIIHPGTPLNPHEKGLEKLLARAARFN